MTLGGTLRAAGCLLALWSGPALPHEAAVPAALEAKRALATSQAAIGRPLGDFAFIDQGGRAVRFSELRGKPLVISVVFTACTQSCPLVLQRLADAAEVAREALGRDAFQLVTVGLDPQVDTPERLSAFLHAQGIDSANWRLLGGDHEAIDALAANLGFSYLPSPRGFDHLAQTSIVDSNGRVAAQVYGDDFDSPALVEPLKAAILGDLSSLASVSELLERVRLFCTFYDSKSDRYAFDYSIFIAMAVALGSLGGLGFLVLRGWFGGGRRPDPS